MTDDGRWMMDDDDGIAPLSHHVAAGAPLRYHVAAGPPLLTAWHLEAKWLEPKWLESKRLEPYRSTVNARQSI